MIFFSRCSLVTGISNNTKDEQRKVVFFLGHSRVDGDYMLRHRNDNNREQAAAQIQLALCLG